MVSVPSPTLHTLTWFLYKVPHTLPLPRNTHSDTGPVSSATHSHTDPVLSTTLRTPTQFMCQVLQCILPHSHCANYYSTQSHTVPVPGTTQSHMVPVPSAKHFHMVPLQSISYSHIVFVYIVLHSPTEFLCQV